MRFVGVDRPGYSDPWFEATLLDEIRADVRFHDGKDDTVAFPQRAKKLAEEIPGSRLRLHWVEGHISVLDRPIQEIVETLLTA